LANAACAGSFVSLAVLTATEAGVLTKKFFDIASRSSH